MKKLLFLAAFAASAFSMNGQLSVLKSGNVRIGSATPKAVATKIVGPPLPYVTVTDSLATLNLLRGVTNGAGAYMTFGNLKNVAVGEFCATSTPSDSDILGLYGSKGIKYLAGDKEVFAYTAPATSSTVAPFVFNCNVKAPSFLTTSDARMKSDIKGISGLSSLLAGVSPVSYRLAPGSEAMKASDADGDLAVPLSPDDRVRYGFVAQEVREIFPDLVVEDAEGYLSIDYMGFIPILVDAYKELEGRVREQEDMIAWLSGGSARRSAAAGIDGVVSDGKAMLLQNRPNPFRDNTVIGCAVPEGSSEAFVCVYDLQGSQVLRLDIEERGDCSVTIDGSSLRPGMYVYALIVDGAEIDTKKMILTD